jgi:hypothetical protein
MAFDHFAVLAILEGAVAHAGVEVAAEGTIDSERLAFFPQDVEEFLYDFFRHVPPPGYPGGIQAKGGIIKAKDSFKFLYVPLFDSPEGP